MKNEVALLSSSKKILAQVGGKMFSDIDFEKLNSTIDILGQKSGEITQEERVVASGYITDWENLVVTRLNEKSMKLVSLHRFLSLAPNASYGAISDWFIGEFSTVVEDILSGENYDNKFLEAYMELQATHGQIEDYRTEHAIIEPIIDINAMTKADIDARKLQFQAAIARLNAAMSKRELSFRRSFLTFKAMLNKDKNFKAFLKALDEQSAAATEARNIVKEKASLARMNVLISSSDIREALKELHSIEKELA